MNLFLRKIYETTEDIHHEDGRRDNAFYRICEIIRSGHRHFDENKREAAVRLHFYIIILARAWYNTQRLKKKPDAPNGFNVS
jgi:hypothetical protein